MIFLKKSEYLQEIENNRNKYLSEQQRRIQFYPLQTRVGKNQAQWFFCFGGGVFQTYFMLTIYIIFENIAVLDVLWVFKTGA